MERDEVIAWAVATGVWLGVIAVLLWLTSRERRPGPRVLAWLGPRVAAGLALWVVAFGATRWAERKLGLGGEARSRAVRSTAPHSGSRPR
ncbi:MAG TPA: hypothetical protein VMT11_04265 [Myxococcaceae bacterium]|nr:hypothetical protein [Myxococcaceae bacterium]